MKIEYILHWTLAINRGWTIKPTARSETARLDSKIFAAECKEGVFHIVIKNRWVSDQGRTDNNGSNRDCSRVIEFVFKVPFKLKNVIKLVLVRIVGRQRQINLHGWLVFLYSRLWLHASLSCDSCLIRSVWSRNNSLERIFLPSIESFNYLFTHCRQSNFIRSRVSKLNGGICTDFQAYFLIWLVLITFCLLGRKLLAIL